MPVTAVAARWRGTASFILALRTSYFFPCPLLSAHPSRCSKKKKKKKKKNSFHHISIFSLLLPDKTKVMNIAFPCAGIAKHESLARNHVTKGTTTLVSDSSDDHM